MCLYLSTVVAFFYWCLPFRLASFRSLLQKHLFLFLIFIVMCMKATQLPIEQHQQQSSFFVGFSRLFSVFTNGEVFLCAHRNLFFLRLMKQEAKNEREEIKILGTLLSQTIFSSFLLNRFSIGINRIRALNIIKYLLSSVEALETDETLERSDRRKEKLNLKELCKNFVTDGSICRALTVAFSLFAWANSNYSFRKASRINCIVYAVVALKYPADCYGMTNVAPYWASVDRGGNWKGRGRVREEDEKK